jgi:hypothetical protein
MGSAQSFGGSAYAAVSRNPHALPPGARGSAPGCVIPRLTSHPGSQATPRNRLTSDPATVSQDDPQPPHETASQATQQPPHKTPHKNTPQKHPTPPRDTTPQNRCAVSHGPRIAARFRGTPDRGRDSQGLRSPREWPCRSSSSSDVLNARPPPLGTSRDGGTRPN